MIHKRGTVPVVCCLHAIVVGLGSYAAAFATLMLVFVLLTACSPSRYPQKVCEQSGGVPSL